MFISTKDIKENLEKEAAADPRRYGSSRLSYVIPRLDNWVIQEDEQRIRILGTLKYHLKYRSGSRIKTSKILRFHKVDGRNIISTRNSIYELGEPALQLHYDPQQSYLELHKKVKDTQANASQLGMEPEDFTRLTNGAA